ncbi:MAG: sortase [Candidatus Shapirobacteria bacterium]
MSRRKRKVPVVNKILGPLGYILVIASAFILVKTFFPVAQAELGYQAQKILPSKDQIVPINTDFSIQIPKIGVNANVVKNVDPYNSSEYQKALTKGVAHAKGSGLPGFPGNIFIFAHSANSWYQANQFNAIFYLTDKLDLDDEITINYEKSEYKYKVAEKKIVKNTDINYLSNKQNTNTLTLMTCWPPGTTLSRLIIIAKSI